MGLRVYNLEKGSESAACERINAKTHQGPIIKQKYCFPNCCELIYAVYCKLPSEESSQRFEIKSAQAKATPAHPACNDCVIYTLCGEKSPPQKISSSNKSIIVFAERRHFGFGSAPLLHCSTER
jgi:hypothetical protein